MPSEGLNLFIVGFAKTGTTSIADWFVANGLARYRVSGVKEPYLYSSFDFTGTDDSAPRDVLLDASVGYAVTPLAISRMPVVNTRVIVCVRNYFDRCYSEYCHARAVAERGQDVQALLETITGRPERDPGSRDLMYEGLFQIYKKEFHPQSEAAIRRYFEEQASNMVQQSFAERIDYEIGFFLSRRTFPFFSVLKSSFYFSGVQDLLRRYAPSDVFVLTVDQLQSESHRRRFASEVLGHEVAMELPPLNRLNATEGLAIARQKPDFGGKEWDVLREWFRQDWRSFISLAETRGVSMKYVNEGRVTALLTPRDGDRFRNPRPSEGC